MTTRFNLIEEDINYIMEELNSFPSRTATGLGRHLGGAIKTIGLAMQVGLKKMKMGLWRKRQRKQKDKEMIQRRRTRPWLKQHEVRLIALRSW